LELPKRRANFSISPGTVIDEFLSPVKNGWHAAQMPILSSRRVEPT